MEDLLLFLFTFCTLIGVPILLTIAQDDLCKKFFNDCEKRIDEDCTE